MRKLVFYPKMALAGLYRNRQAYLPYLLACIVSISTFYILLSINFNSALDDLPYLGYVRIFTAIATFILSIFCAILLFYTNSFLIKRRKKEIGLYSILGMEKKNIGILMLLETLFTSAIALIMGILAGTLFSKLVFLGLLKLMRVGQVPKIEVSFTSIYITVIFFGIVFLLTLLQNLRQVRIANPVELMAGSKQGEKEPRASIVVTILGVLFVGGGYYMALSIKSPLEALFGFLLAALLVIIGTYCLFTSGSIALLKMLRKNKKYYYKADHFISVSGMIYRMKQNAAGLASICILSCMVLVTVSSTLSLYTGSQDSLHTFYPHDFVLTGTDVEPEVFEAEVQKVEEMVGSKNVVPQNRQMYTSYIVNAKQENEKYVSYLDEDRNVMLYRFSVISVDDYNRMENKNEVLPRGEALLYERGQGGQIPELNLNGSTYTTRKIDMFDTVKAGSQGVTFAYVLVLNNEDLTELLADGQSVSRKTLTYSFDVEGEKADKELLFDEYMDMVATMPFIARLDSRMEIEVEWYSMFGGFLFLGVYFGVLFLLAAAMIIYYKQLSEGYDDRERFVILQKVGMSADEVKRTINSQIRTVFFSPLVVSVLHVAVATVLISKVMTAFSIFNTGVLALTTLAVIVVYALVYYLIYKRTAKTYFNIVRWGN